MIYGEEEEEGLKQCNNNIRNEKKSVYALLLSVLFTINTMKC